MDITWNPAIEKELFTDVEIADNNSIAWDNNSIAWEKASMSKQEAYKIVFHDLIDNGSCMFTGIYDGKNGSKEFMYGIETVMEYIADKSSEEDYLKFCEDFINNMVRSQQEGLDYTL